MKRLPDLTHAEVLRHLAREVELAGSMTRAARTLGVSHQLLSDILRGRRSVGPKLLRALHLQRVRLVVWRYAPAPKKTVATSTRETACA